MLGDGVQHPQATAAGDIWVGYSDEGVFGNMVGDSSSRKSAKAPSAKASPVNPSI